jgi:predicted ATPase
VLEAQFSDTKETQPELLAHHYTEAGLIAQAIPYWQKAGERANQRSAHLEAISHLIKGLDLLKTLPDTPERAQQELMLQIALSIPLRATKGYGAPEMEQIYTRAWALCQQLGETPQLFPVLWGMWYFYFVRAELQTARELGRHCLALAQKVQNPELLIEAYFALGQTSRVLGELTLAQEFFEQGIALYNPLQHRSLAFLYGQNPEVIFLSVTAWVLWLLGYPDQALKRIHQALSLAQELSHPFSLAFALCLAAWLHHYRREGQAAQEWAEASITLSTEQGFPFWLAQGTCWRGWALAEQGQGEEGIQQLHQGLTAWRAIGTEVARPGFLASLAEAYGKTGQAGEGLTILAEALATVNRTGERFYEAELYRLKGELTLQQESQKAKVKEQKSKIAEPRSLNPDPQVEAEACFLKAIEIARKQQAKSLELRAVTSLARLWQRQGKRDEAHQLLFEIYNWFTEGFDTKDLQEARALLHELSN